MVGFIFGNLWRKDHSWNVFSFKLGVASSCVALLVPGIIFNICSGTCSNTPKVWEDRVDSYAPTSTRTGSPISISCGVSLCSLTRKGLDVFLIIPGTVIMATSFHYLVCDLGSQSTTFFTIEDSMFTFSGFSPSKMRDLITNSPRIMFKNCVAFLLGFVEAPLYCMFIFLEVGFSFLGLMILLLVAFLTTASNFWNCTREPSTMIRRFCTQYNACVHGFWLSFKHSSLASSILSPLYLTLQLVASPVCLFILISPCLLESFTKEVTCKDLDAWYAELAEGKFGQILFIRPNLRKFQEQSGNIDWSSNSMELTRSNLEGLQERGLIPVLLPTNTFQCYFWYFYPVGKMFSSSCIANYYYHQSVFVSHRWAKNGGWHGEHGWQFHEMINYLAENPQIEYMWVDGLCAPQEKYKSNGKPETLLKISDTNKNHHCVQRAAEVNVTMAVIDHLLDIIEQCKYFVCIDGSAYDIDSSEADHYLNRVWCLYELFLSTTEQEQKWNWAMPYRCKREPRTMEALYPKGFQFSLLSHTNNEKLLEKLFVCFSTKAEDKQRIINNVLGMNARHNQKLIQEAGIWSRFRAFEMLDSYPCSYTYFPIEKVVALHVIFVKLREISAISDDVQQLPEQTTRESMPYDLEEEKASTEGGTVDFVLPEIERYSKLHCHQHILGFDSYYVHQLFKLSCLLKVQILQSEKLPIQGTQSLVICGKLLVKVFGLIAVVTINCCPQQKICYLNFALQHVEGKTGFRTAPEWNDSLEQDISKYFWYEFLISNKGSYRLCT